MQEVNNRLARLFSRVFAEASVQVVESGDLANETRLAIHAPSGDWHLRVIWAGEGWPADTQNALKDVAEGSWPPDLVLAARHFSPGSKDLLASRNANWADESAAAHIFAPGLFVLRESSVEKSPQPEFSWSPSAIAVAEALLARDWAGGVGTTELANLIGWSPPQMSQVLQAFDTEGWTAKYGARRGRGARRELVDPDGLLNAWSTFIARQERNPRLAHKTLRAPLQFLEEELGAALDMEVRWALGGWAAAHELAPISSAVPSLQIYVHEDDFEGPLDRAIREAGLSDVAEGGRVAFFPAHASVLALSQPTRLAPLVSSPRAYADLKALGGRGVDAAEHLKEEAIHPIHRPRGQRKAPRGLLDWEQECHKRLERLVEDRADMSGLYEDGTWSASYRLVGAPKPPEPRKFLAILREVAGQETGWPAWWAPLEGHGRPRPLDGMIECWLSDTTFGDSAHADYWRADPQGRLCLIRGYEEDSTFIKLVPEPGTAIDLTLPIWRTGECLLHAERLARRLDAPKVQFMVRWSSLRGRKLVAVAQRNRQLKPTGPTKQDEVVSYVETTPEEIHADLPGVVRRLTDPLYTSFDFFDPPPGIYDEELAKMRSGDR